MQTMVSIHEPILKKPRMTAKQCALCMTAKIVEYHTKLFDKCLLIFIFVIMCLVLKSLDGFAHASYQVA